MRLCVSLDGRGRELEASAMRTIGLRQDQRYRKPGVVQRGQRPDREVGRAGEADAQGEGDSAQLASFCFLRSLASRRARLRGEMRSTKTLPSRWSISC